jgi:hypothetical protein
MKQFRRCMREIVRRMYASARNAAALSNMLAKHGPAFCRTPVRRFEMKITKLALALLVGFGSGCASLTPAPTVSMADLPNCFDSNYDRERGLFTIKGDLGKKVNQQCLLTVGPRGDVASQRLPAGNYRVYLANGGGGGAGGTLQSFLSGGGGGGGGGAGSAESQVTVNLTEGVYKITIGAGGLGGTAGELQREGFGGGVGGAGSPSNIVRVATGELVLGTPGADTYARPSRAQSDRAGGRTDDAHGGSGPGQASGGSGADTETIGGVKVQVAATPGTGKRTSGGTEPGGATGTVSAGDTHPGSGGGGGATSIGHGGGGGGESPGQRENPPQRGSLGSGGGGGEGSISGTDPGARGGHGFIAFRRI